jgi:hydrogenase nickel incorporation protein HypA/HybF
MIVAAAAKVYARSARGRKACANGGAPERANAILSRTDDASGHPEQKRSRRLHELSIAVALLEGVSEEAQRLGICRVDAVRVRIGALSGVAPDALSFSWELAAQGTIAAGSRLDIETVPLAIRCSACGDESTPPVATGLACTRCGSGPTTIVRGRELQLIAMEVPEL